MNPGTEPAFTTTVPAIATGPLIEAAGELDLDGAPSCTPRYAAHSRPARQGPIW